jgi:hypothetical protein
MAWVGVIWRALPPGAGVRGGAAAPGGRDVRVDAAGLAGPGRAGLREDTTVPRERLVHRFGEFAGECPWQWLPGAHGRMVAAPDR